MPQATDDQAGRAATALPLAAPRRRGRALAVFLSALAVLVATVGLAGPARAYEWNVLCTGYDACATAGYSNSGYKDHSSTSYWSQSTGHNCTNYVAYRLVTNGLPNKRPAQLSGNAYNWGTAFASQTDDAPAVGSVAWWGQSFSSTGHIAYVEKVVSADQILVSEDNWGGDFRWRSVTRSGGLWPAGFIHLKDMGPKVAAPASYPTYRPVAPTRIVDTRSSLGATGPLAAGSDTSILVSGKAGLPRTAIGAVVVNVTVVRPQAEGYLLAYPSGTSPAASSTVNFDPGAVVANQAVVGVGSDGRIRIKVSQATDVLVDVVGWYPSFGNLTTTTPTRILDTRYGQGAPAGRLQPGSRIDLTVTGSSVVPASGVDSVLLNVTAARPTKDGNLAVWPTGAAEPNSSSLNFSSGSSISGLVVAKVGSNGRVSIRTSAATDVIADVVGWYPSGADYLGLTPARLLDTRNGTGVAASGPVAAGGVVRLQVTGRGGVPSTGVKAVVLTLVVTGPQQPGHLIAYPSGSSRPTTSNLNFVAGQTIANTAVVTPSSDGYVDIYVYQSTQVVADVQGYLAS
ncbi:CHAP domain-containing protein [Terrabacter carboxydivorans]|uniref:Peptidase C51 domain-containing protein n=1 Tax=Terrabacter carboxydivorans TaxID=619730 RepID=A0ABN3L054_9MICO